VRSAPLGTPRTASHIRGSGCRRRAGARLLLAGDYTFEDGLGIARTTSASPPDEPEGFQRLGFENNSRSGVLSD